MENLFRAKQGSNQVTLRFGGGKGQILVALHGCCRLQWFDFKVGGRVSDCTEDTSAPFYSSEGSILLIKRTSDTSIELVATADRNDLTSKLEDVLVVVLMT